MEAKQILKLLLEQSYISQDDIKRSEQTTKGDPAKTLQYLVMRDIVNRNIIGQAIAENYGLRYVDLSASKIDPTVIQKLPEDVAKKYKALMIGASKKKVTIGISSPVEATTKTEIEKLFKGLTVEYVYIDTDFFKKHLAAYRPQLNTQFNKIIESGTRIAPEIVQQIVQDALLLGSSDVHFEPYEQDIVIRFRIDGVLQEAGRIPKKFYDVVVNRIKIEARLRIDEHFASQDGSIHYKNEDVEADLRISIVPTMNGEKIVMRVLSEYVRDLTLLDLGLQDDDQQKVLVASNKPFGMILVTGPTGSGKTTTLYSLIKNINNSELNITTIEEPVEYRIEGINQIQVNQQTGLTFAKGLRSIARQDPDIILVGEIRDLDTAEIAVNAALTGHMLFTTFHANDAAAAIPRLLDMGIEPFLLASTLELIIAQRLARKICESCKTSYQANIKDLAQLWKDAPKYFGQSSVTLYKGKGCDTCKNTGYSGRIGIFELISMTPEIRDIIVTNPSSSKVRDLASQNGSRTLFMDGLDKVKNGLTTYDELLRVVSPPEPTKPGST